MIHVRIASPTAVTPELTGFLREDDVALNIVELPGPSEHLEGDTLHVRSESGIA
jgi:hypothetical protein